MISLALGRREREKEKRPEWFPRGRGKALMPSLAPSFSSFHFFPPSLFHLEIAATQKQSRKKSRNEGQEELQLPVLCCYSWEKERKGETHSLWSCFICPVFSTPNTTSLASLRERLRRTIERKIDRETFLSLPCMLPPPVQKVSAIGSAVCK